MPANANRLEVIDLTSRLPTPAELEQRKLDRLRELRAVIESLRTGPIGQDPLLTWAIGQENAGHR